jgi:hypothetical protein
MEHYLTSVCHVILLVGNTWTQINVYHATQNVRHVMEDSIVTAYHASHHIIWITDTAVTQTARPAMVVYSHSVSVVLMVSTSQLPNSAWHATPRVSPVMGQTITTVSHARISRYPPAVPAATPRASHAQVAQIRIALPAIHNRINTLSTKSINVSQFVHRLIHSSMIQK